VLVLDRENTSRRSSFREPFPRTSDRRRPTTRRGRVVYVFYDDARTYPTIRQRPSPSSWGGKVECQAGRTGRPAKQVRAESRRLSTGSLLV